ncbi:MAG: class I SAM-dependent methyltransferase [Chlorobiales bacterium]|nr:class I SAM-dependent methyltransferase [Chlorobiales bacterium]
MMERPGCPITGNTSPHPFMKVSDRFGPNCSEQWQLVRDPESGLIYLSPRPDETEIATYYPSVFYDPHLSITSTRTFRDKLYLAFRNIVLKKKASLIEKSGPPLTSSSKILEVGCSTGELLDMLRRRNGIPPENCLGFEKNSRSASHARNAFGLTINNTDFCDRSLAERFDRIIFWHTLEHIHRINETLDKAAQCLGPKGAMVVALPNAGSFDATLYGKYWVAWDAPRHLYHFTPATLGKLLNRHGLEITSMHPFIPDTFYNCIYSGENIRREKGGSAFPHIARGLIQGMRSAVAGTQNNELSSTLVYTVHRSGSQP